MQSRTHALRCAYAFAFAWSSRAIARAARASSAAAVALATGVLAFATGALAFPMGALAFATCTVASCATIERVLPWGGGGAPKKLPKEEVPAALEKARALLDAGDSKRALEWMTAASEAKSLAPELRDEVQQVLETAADRRIQDLSARPGNGEELADMVELGLPRQLAVTAGVRGARQMFESGEDMDAFRLIKQIDQKYPLHHERRASGELLVEIGMHLAKERRGFLGIFESTDDAQEVLEYLILNQPWASRCDEAYATLAAIYEEGRDWELAIERHSGLVLNHPQSPLRAASQARIPHLRLASVTSVEYDRNELKSARKELEEWLRRYSGHELEPAVRLDLGDCLRRLSESDLLIADFYGTVDNEYGAHWHSARALQSALDAGDEALASRAREFLGRHPAPEPAAPPPADEVQ